MFLLDPAGSAQIDGKEYDVVTDGDYIDVGAKIKVTDVRGNVIVIQEKDPDD